ncbi:hypothetical protein HanHA300_Chr07g0258251 [Helianthus annuus]|nr:hypothetical protein HanHA300_Chr07g0258251 [Helianthus annuus]KAJ0564502.1 hypothetical protein HanHA89_Chr07g0275011 [Helianthus annuus]KAJ0729819.1 hypothetical protein HanLR1_Chr07g0257191 [Helianthus annuus]KAJ0732561.1 hypothetical protein HanOQP8_Chr07g0264581 [Helianthus annuus]
MLSNVVMFPRFLHFFGSEYSPMEAHGVSFRHVLVLCRRGFLEFFIELQWRSNTSR